MRLAIVGTGMIAADALQALQNIPQIEVTSIFARPASEEKGKELASKFSVPKVYTDYDLMLAETDADFIYIGNANVAHAQFAEKAILAGKHLIIEKPICVTLAELRKIWNMARERKLFVFEAVMFLHSPVFEKIREAVGKLGKIHSVQCNYSKYSSRYDRYLREEITPVFDPACAGGALLDLNIYNINLLAALFGLPTGEIRYFPVRGFNGIDTSGTLVMEYDSFCATCTAAKDSGSPRFDIIQGEKGHLIIRGISEKLSKVEVHTSNEDIQFDMGNATHKMVDEFLDFERIFESNDYESCLKYMDISLKAIEIADRALKNATR